MKSKLKKWSRPPLFTVGGSYRTIALRTFKKGV